MLAEPGPGADCLQRPLVPRSRFRQQLRPSVRRQKVQGKEMMHRVPSQEMTREVMGGSNVSLLLYEPGGGDR